MYIYYIYIYIYEEEKEACYLLIRMLKSPNLKRKREFIPLCTWCINNFSIYTHSYVLYNYKICIYIYIYDKSYYLHFTGV